MYKKKIILAGAAIGLSVMGCYSWASSNGHDLHHFNLVPVISLSFVIFISSIGIIPIPYIIIAEVLPQKVCISPNNKRCTNLITKTAIVIFFHL